MAMSCDIISGINCIEVLFSIVTIISNVKQIISFSCTVYIISVDGSMLINNNTINKENYTMFSLHYVFY